MGYSVPCKIECHSACGLVEIYLCSGHYIPKNTRVHCLTLHIHIYTHFQKRFHTEKYADRYILLFCCTCARVQFSHVIVQLVKNLSSKIIFFSSAPLFHFNKEYAVHKGSPVFTVVICDGRSIWLVSVSH